MLAAGDMAADLLPGLLVLGLAGMVVGEEGPFVIAHDASSMASRPVVTGGQMAVFHGIEEDDVGCSSRYEGWAPWPRPKWGRSVPAVATAA